MKGWTKTTIPDRVKLMMRDRKPLGKLASTMEEIDAANEVKSEREFQNQIADYLRQRNIKFFQAPFGRKSRMAEGMPDFQFTYRGFGCYIEAKGANGKLSPEQKETYIALTSEPNLAMVCIAFKLDAVKEMLDRIDGQTRF